MAVMRLLLALLTAVAFTATASAVGPVAKHTAAGNSAAKTSLLTLRDLGKAWTSKPTATSGLHFSCRGWSPSATGIVETGVASSPAFSASTVGPFVSQQTSVYGSSKQASTLWNRAIQPGLIACVVQSVQSISAQGVTVKITSKGPLQINKAAKLTTAYRVTATLSSAKVKYKRTLYFDVILVGNGNTVSEITLSSLLKPVPASVENALAKLVSNRIGLPTA
jgi:hypothetical protein